MVCSQPGIYQQIETFHANEILVALNTIIAIDTLSFFDSVKRSSVRENLNVHEVHKIRLLRVHLSRRPVVDPSQRWLYRYLQAFIIGNYQEEIRSSVRHHRWIYQNIILIPDSLEHDNCRLDSCLSCHFLDYSIK